VKKILAIDGGGIKGVFPASLLCSVEQAVGRSITDYFDLIVGTSTGGIIALALGLGYSAQDILNFYEDLGQKVFNGNRAFRWFRQWFRSKYDDAPLHAALESKFKGRLLGESSTRLVIPSASLETGEVHIFKTAHHPRFERDYLVPVVDVAMATAAAPTYFPTHITEFGTPLIDGGMWANNPAGLAAVEAIGILEWNPGTFRILSIGCTETPLDLRAARRFAQGKGYWSANVADLFMSLQSSGSIGTAQLLAGHKNILRISPSMPDGRFSLDKTSEFDSLKGLGDSEARKALPEIRKLFLDSPAEKFVPLKQL
jgi:patatin-like phospholipase/acyl hydrolase